MSKGAGRVERVVRDMLAADPAGTFMLEDFLPSIFPDANLIEKKHRVSLLRAIKNLPNADGCWWYFQSANYVKGVPYILFNRLNLRSLGVAKARSEYHACRGMVACSDAAAEQHALRPDSETYQLIQVDGPYPVLFQYYHACVRQDEAQKSLLWDEYSKLVHRVVYRQHDVTSPLHPDFLKDCKTTGALAS